MPSISQKHSEPIAIVGSSCRLPGEASSPSKLWDLLKEPRDVLSEIPSDSRFSPEGFYHPDGLHHGTTNVRHAYTLSEDPRLFDAQFFSIKPVEAEAIDPQQRLVLESVYESLEAAGLSIESLRGSQTAVYVGQMCNDYNDHLLRDFDAIPTYFATGVSRAIMSNRVSYFFDWHGPSMTIDTACSSSLVALHQAVQTLRNGESSVAVAAGTNLLLGPEWFVSEAKLKMLSPEGRSRMWSDTANGYARGEGVASVILKPLSEALADGDEIECVIRETGVNQDGKTSGITVPSSDAQMALIKETYAKTGLDPRKTEDRCQYFEAHGTGTKAGDPKEAAAVAEAFFDLESESEEDAVLHVGSIKTLIGHTEGTSGLAGVLKASLAIQQSTITPNMHFEELNPEIEPYYKHLRILTKSMPWPAVPSGQPKRASVNSFGFGGTNAHAILESYERPKDEQDTSSPANFLPFVFSANSETSLRSMLADYSSFLKSNPEINVRDLAWTLLFRRSALPVKVAFSAEDSRSLAERIDEKLKELETDSQKSVGQRLPMRADPIRILGVFTGQGAQWATMGKQLILQSELARISIEKLEASLSDLGSDRPDWSLKEQLMADSKSSRLSEAALSQPLCTAVQIMLVDLLWNAGIQFSAVVGHSSGEIAAAYASGYLTTTDAIRIAYYRGFHAKLASGPEGVKGAMLAAGLDIEGAQNLCDSSQFKGRISVAASNSSSGVTLSGDSDAIEEAKKHLDDKKTFARKLQVDTAYHSHHMQPCAGPYSESLRACNIQVKEPLEGLDCTWFSSVHGGTEMEPTEDLKESYWRENMVQTVLFSQAVESAVTIQDSFDLVIECGPHPALKGPASQTMNEVGGENIPYTGLIARNKNDVSAFADALGFIWTQTGGQTFEFKRFDSLACVRSTPRLLKGLPTYSWEHERVYWSESRMAKEFRNKTSPSHPLLGTKLPDGTKQEHRWRNLLNPRELPWLSGHELQGQVIFPAAGYAAMALEASMSLARDQNVDSLEVQDLTIERPILFAGDNTGVEVLISLTNVFFVSETSGTAKFTCYSPVGKESSDLEVNAQGSVQVTFGNSQPSITRCTDSDVPHLLEFDTDQFYSSLSELGYNCTGTFQGLSALKRWTNSASGLIEDAEDQQDPSTKLMIHPATLDLAIQAMFAAYCSPGDGRLWSLHVPTHIRRLTIDPRLCYSKATRSLPFSAILDDNTFSEIVGDVEILDESRHTVIAQLEGVKLIPLSEASSTEDRLMFAHTIWDVAEPNAQSLATKVSSAVSVQDADLASICEQVVVSYTHLLSNATTTIERNTWSSKLQYFLELLQYRNLKGSTDTPFKDLPSVATLLEQYPANTDLQVLRAIGENLPALCRGQYQLSDTATIGMLEDMSQNTLGLGRCREELRAACQTLTHRYGDMKILELSNGNIGTSKTILNSIGTAFSSYTSNFASEEVLSELCRNLDSKTDKITRVDINREEDLKEQGLNEQSFDLVIVTDPTFYLLDASKTLSSISSLLKTGGHLLMLAVLDSSPLRTIITMGTSVLLRSSSSESESLSIMSSVEWDSVLKENGFSGVDFSTEKQTDPTRPFVVMGTTALDDRIKNIQNPIWAENAGFNIEDLLIIGGQSLENSKLAEEIGTILSQKSPNISFVRDVKDAAQIEIPFMSTVIVLSDLDEPLFKSFTKERMEGLKRIFDQAKVVLWLTKGCRSGDPYASMSLGFGRTIRLESPQLTFQFLDLDTVDQKDAALIAKALLRIHIADRWESEENANSILWTTEPELAMEKGDLLIPRVLPNKSANERYNSTRRSILKQVNSMSSPVEITASNSISELRELDLVPNPVDSGSGLARIQVSYSSLKAVDVSSKGSFFLVQGFISASNQTVIGFSDINGSIVDISSDRLLPIDFSESSKLSFESALNFLVARRLFSAVSESEMLLVHEPPLSLKEALLAVASVERKVVSFLGSTEQTRNISPRTTSRKIKALLPRKVSAYTSFSTDNITGQRISDLLDPSVKRVKQEEVLKDVSRCETVASCSWKEILRDAVGFSLRVPREYSIKPLTPNEVTQNGPVPRLSVVDWFLDRQISVAIRPVDSQNMFEDSKTYILFGLTGTIGLSLCQWMVNHGAKHIVLASRKPVVDATWLNTMKGLGANIMVESCDLSSRSDMQRLYESIKITQPPLGGVANGAMILEDSRFSEMSFENFQSALKPKVAGTLNINEVFGDEQLDFFILFSSITSVSGSTGQSNYTAANTFMAGVAAERRKHGLAASVMDVGVVSGIGYLAGGMSQSMEENLRKVSPRWVSERDIQLMFAEAVLAGKPESGLDHEIITGVDRVKPTDKIKTYWHGNPKFQYYLDEGEQESGNGSSGAVPIKLQLASASTTEEVFQALNESFAQKLSSMLQMGDVESASILGKGTDELGIDSLVAVEVRTFFMKELSVDVPVLKILSGTTVRGLLELVVEKLPQDLASNIGSSASKNVSKEPKPSCEPVSDLKKETSGEKSSSSSQATTRSGSPVSTSSTPKLRAETPATEIDSDTEDATSKNILSAQRMSPGQSGFWFLRSFLEDPTTFNITCLFTLKGKVNKEKLANAISQVGQKHEALRTCFFVDNDHNPKQGVMDTTKLHLETKDAESRKDADDMYSTLCAYNYQIEKGELMRIVLLSQSPSTHYLLIGYNHINMDGVSLQVLLLDLEKAYKGQKFEDEGMVQCPIFSERQHSSIEREDWKNDMDYWHEKFPDLPPVLDILPTSQIKVRQSLRKQDLNEVDFFVNSSLANRVKDACRKNKVTPFHFYLAVFKTLLFRLSNNDDLAIGFANANRNDTDTLNAIGIYLTLLPLRFKFQESQNFADAMTEAKKKVYGALGHSSVTLDILMEELDVPRSSTYSPLFQAFFDFRQGAKENFPFADCKVEGQQYATGRTGYDISVDIWENAGGEPHIFLKTQSYLYSKEDAQSIMDCYKNLIEAFARNPATTVEQPSLYSKKQVEEATTVGRGPDMESTWPVTLIHKIDEITQQNLQTIAVKDGLGTCFTYGDLSKMVSNIANLMLQNNVSAGDRVVVFQEPTAYWVCSMLAIMRIGAVYLPLDLRNLMERLAAIVGNASPKAVLAHEKTADRAPQLGVSTSKILDIAKLSDSEKQVPNSADPESAAYILHTSGSTGTPKGILVKHSSFKNHVEGFIKTFDLEGCHVLQQSAFSFDLAMEQMMIGLCGGGSVFIAPRTIRADPVETSKTIAREGISWTKATPSEYSSWIRYGVESLSQAQAWTIAWSGGERLTEVHRHEFRSLNKPDLKLFDSYGPAESSLACSKIQVSYLDKELSEADRQAPIPAGLPLPNYTILIVDRQLKPVPIGIPGKIVIGGAGPALGYLNLDDLTNEKFVTNRHVHHWYKNNGWDRMYKTGDYGRLRSDGALIFEGRIGADSQVKLRGNRIELGDVESSIVKASNGAIAEAVVTVRGDPEYLVAHVVLAKDNKVQDQNAFFKQLLSSLPLPQYMCPAMIITLDGMPLNNHSKIDRRAVSQLPLNQETEAATSDAELSKTENRLKDVWAKVLSKDIMNSIPITPQTQFFQLGGNSVLLPRLQVLVREHFDVALPLIDFFESNTIGAMSEKIDSNSALEEIDWEEESSIVQNELKPEFLQKISTDKPAASADNRSVLMTGATGFAGRTLLQQLADDDTISKIHIVALRNNENNTREIPVKSDKIQVHNGDLQSPLLGMTEESFARFAEEVDFIIHTAAIRAFWEYYQVVGQANFGSTKTLAAMAAPRKIPILFVSSGGVLQFVGDTIEPISVADGQPPTDGSNGYLAAKWASERYLERAAAQEGIPVRIYRTTPLPEGLKTDQGVLDEYLAIGNQMKLLPRVGGLKGNFDVIPVKSVASAVQDSMADVAANGGLEILHYKSVAKVDFIDMQTYLEENKPQDDQWEQMDVLGWIGRVKANGSAFQIASQNLTLDQMDEETGAPLVSKR